MSDLPENWEWARLDEISEIRGGIQKQQKRKPIENKYPFLRVANVSRGNLDLSDVHEVELFDGELEKFRLQQGDLLVVEGNGSIDQLGRAALWSAEIPDCVHQNHLIRVRPAEGINPQFVALVWNSPFVTTQLKAKAWSTSGLHTLSVSKLSNIQLPVPPSVEQDQIVAVLEDHLSRLDAAIASIQLALNKAQILADRTFSSLLDDTTFEQLPTTSILAEPLINGRSVPSKDNGFPVLRLTALRNGNIDLNERKSGAWTRSEAESWLVKRGDFLISRGNGSLNLVGRGGLVTDEPDEVAFPDTLIRLRPNKNIDPEFLSLIWNSREIRVQIESAARTTAGIHKVNQSILKKVQLRVPSIRNQRRMVSEIRNVVDFITRLRSAATQVVAQQEALRRQLLSDAFSGQLTSRSVDSEPASILLGRIKSELNSATISKNSRRRTTARTEQNSGPTQETLL